MTSLSLESGINFTVDFLKAQPWCLSSVAAWCAAEWPSYYEDGKYQVAYDYHLTTLQTDKIPCGFVAFSGDIVLGTISILEEDMSIRPQYTPWLGCLYVDPEFRDRKATVAKELNSFAEQHINQLGIKELYAWSHSLETPMKHLGWKEIERVNFLEEEAVILRKSF